MGTAAGGYPAKLEDIEVWSRDRGVTMSEARRRFAQYAACLAVAASPFLREQLVFKGGNALFFAYGNPRSTTDLDFSAPADQESLSREQVKLAFDAILPEIGKRLGLKLRVQSTRVNPPNLITPTPTYEIRIAYALPGEKTFERWNLVRNLSTIVEVEIAVNEIVCASETPLRDPGLDRLKVCKLEDIVAEKLRPLLQQVTRNRARPQDLFDLANILQSPLDLDWKCIAEYLIRKARARGIDPSRSAFRDARVWDCAAQGYEALRSTVKGHWIDFQPARQCVLSFLDRLDLPPEGPPLKAREPRRKR